MQAKEIRISKIEILIYIFIWQRDFGYGYHVSKLLFFLSEILPTPHGHETQLLSRRKQKRRRNCLRSDPKIRYADIVRALQTTSVIPMCKIQLLNKKIVVQDINGCAAVDQATTCTNLKLRPPPRPPEANRCDRFWIPSAETNRHSTPIFLLNIGDLLHLVHNRNVAIPRGIAACNPATCIGRRETHHKPNITCLIRHIVRRL